MLTVRPAKRGIAMRANPLVRFEDPTICLGPHGAQHQNVADALGLSVPVANFKTSSRFA